MSEAIIVVAYSCGLAFFFIGVGSALLAIIERGAKRGRRMRRDAEQRELRRAS